LHPYGANCGVLVEVRVHAATPRLASVASEPHDILSPSLTVIGLTDAQMAPARFAHGTLECHPQPTGCRVKHIHKPSSQPVGLSWAGGGDLGGTKKGLVSLYFHSASIY